MFLHMIVGADKAVFDFHVVQPDSENAPARR
jgi:hypothetical protein